MGHVIDDGIVESTVRRIYRKGIIIQFRILIELKMRIGVCGIDEYFFSAEHHFSVRAQFECVFGIDRRLEFTAVNAAENFGYIHFPIDVQRCLRLMQNRIIDRSEFAFHL